MNRLAILLLVSIVFLLPFLINDAEAKVFIVKAVDELVTASETLQDDDELFFTCDANTTYAFELSMFFISPSGAGISNAWTIPSGATGRWTDSQLQGSSTSLTNDVTVRFDHNAGAGTEDNLTYKGHIDVGGTAGTCTYQWAQFNSNGSPTTVVKGTTLEVFQEGTTLTGVDGLAFAKVVKATDESDVNNAVLQNDDELKVTLSANKDYSFTAFIFVTAVSTAPDIKLAWTIPSGATGDKNAQGTAWNGFSVVNNITTGFDADLSTSVEATEIHGRVNMGSTAGDLQLTWSQRQSSADATTVLKGSSLKVWEEGTTLASAQGEQGIQGIQGIQGVAGVAGARGADGASPVSNPVAPVDEEAIIEAVLAEIDFAEPNFVESAVKTFFEFSVIDSSHDQLVLNSFLGNERLGIRWSSGQDMIVTSAVPASSPFLITFEQFPSVKRGSGAVISTDFILYNIGVPNIECTTQVTSQCVQKVRYEIPITVNGIVAGQEVSDVGNITVDLSEGTFDPILLLILSMFFIPLAGILFQRSRGRSARVPVNKLLQ